MDNYEILEQELEAYRGSLPEPGEKWPFKIQTAHDCIVQHLFDPRLSVNWMKQRCRINGHNLSAKFRHYTGLSLHTFKSHHRIEVAKLLLADSRFEECTISDIAVEVGFRSISAFSKSFKNHTGRTPSWWREENMNS